MLLAAGTRQLLKWHRLAKPQVGLFGCDLPALRARAPAPSKPAHEAYASRHRLTEGLKGRTRVAPSFVSGGRGYRSAELIDIRRTNAVFRGDLGDRHASFPISLHFRAESKKLLAGTAGRGGCCGLASRGLTLFSLTSLFDQPLSKLDDFLQLRQFFRRERQRMFLSMLGFPTNCVT